jgi:hypothetical protein
MRSRCWSNRATGRPVARIAAEDADTMLDQGRAETLAMWIESLPETLRAGEPRLLVALGRLPDGNHATRRAALFRAGIRRVQDRRRCGRNAAKRVRRR